MITGIHGIASSRVQFTPMFNLFGYAAETGGTTGALAPGGTYQDYTATNFTEFKNACEAGEEWHLNIKFAPVGAVASGTGLISVKSNKTITGTLGSKLIGASLFIQTQNNIIIRNMTIEKVEENSNIIIKDGSHHVWVDHCDLSSDRTHGYDFYDGLIDIGNQSNYVTLTWNKFHDNPIANLIGFADGLIADRGTLKTTIYGNHYYNNNERNPTIRYGDVHVFNNYIADVPDYAMASTVEGRMRLENNSFENVNTPYRDNFNASAGEVSGLETSLYVSCGANIAIGNTASTYRPPYTYSNYIIPSANVKAIVIANSGAILNVV